MFRRSAASQIVKISEFLTHWTIYINEMSKRIIFEFFLLKETILGGDTSGQAHVPPGPTTARRCRQR
jgi:hypothetical protein